MRYQNLCYHHNLLTRFPNSFVWKFIKKNGNKPILCEGNADTTIARELLNTEKSTVVVIAYDTLVSCLPLRIEFCTINSYRTWIPTWIFTCDQFLILKKFLLKLTFERLNTLFMFFLYTHFPDATQREQSTKCLGKGFQEARKYLKSSLAGWSDEF